MDTLDFAAGGEAGEEFAANFRQHGVGDEGIEDAGAAFQLANTKTLPGRAGRSVLKRGGGSVLGCMVACDFCPPIRTAGVPGRRIGLPT